ncbi:MAG: hypothetical protein ACYS21_19230 [Planctomycetota bacterium]|jgi:hypothetical protein
MERTRVLLNVVILVIALGMAGVANSAPMGTAFTYQGRLSDANSPADGSYDFEFELFDQDAGGNQFGNTVTKDEVDVIDGYFTVLLDFVNDANVLDGDARWLQIAVRPGEMKDPNIYTSLQARQKITSAPYATFALNTSGAGSTFTRWGNPTAPAGTTLVYSGYGFAGYYDHSGSSGQPIVIQGGDPGPSRTLTWWSSLYPLNTHSVDRYIKAAVCYVDVPTLVIWGTHTPPSGWTIVYRGYAMGSRYNFAQSVGPICVDCENFDSSHTTTANSSVLVGAVTRGAEVGAPYYSDRDKDIKCAVIKKN